MNDTNYILNGVKKRDNWQWIKKGLKNSETKKKNFMKVSKKWEFPKMNKF